jgi:hypothetical protein
VAAAVLGPLTAAAFLPAKSARHHGQFAAPQPERLVPKILAIWWMNRHHAVSRRPAGLPAEQQLAEIAPLRRRAGNALSVDNLRLAVDSPQ